MIIQCKHWLSKSINIQDINLSRDQMKLWVPPRVDVHIIVTSGLFTTDAVKYVEKNNQFD
ncbi:MAG: restriction endonuclease [bacterium]